MPRNDSVGFAYAYNVAGVDPAPFATRVRKRVAELKEDFKPSDYERILGYLAETELKIEDLKEKNVREKQS